MNNSDRLKDLRKDNHLTQKQLAKILNMSQTGYSKYETGENDLSTEMLKKLSAIYNVSIDYILGITDEYSPYERNDSFKTIEKSLKTR